MKKEHRIVIIFLNITVSFFYAAEEMELKQLSERTTSLKQQSEERISFPMEVNRESGKLVALKLLKTSSYQFDRRGEKDFLKIVKSTPKIHEKGLNLDQLVESFGKLSDDQRRLFWLMIRNPWFGIDDPYLYSIFLTFDRDTQKVVNHYRNGKLFKYKK